MFSNYIQKKKMKKIWELILFLLNNISLKKNYFIYKIYISIDRYRRYIFHMYIYICIIYYIRCNQIFIKIIIFESCEFLCKIMYKDMLKIFDNISKLVNSVLKFHILFNVILIQLIITKL